MKNNDKPPTKRERARIALILSLTCIYCTLSGDFRTRPLENHHIVRGNKRLGHWYTLQVCAGHHKGEWTDQAIRVGIASGRHALKEAYGYDELELWQRQQVALGLDDELPTTKILPRRLGGTRHVEVDTASDPDSIQALLRETPTPTILPRVSDMGDRAREESDAVAAGGEPS